MRRALTLALILVPALAAAAPTFVASNRLRVTATSATEFHVAYGGLGGSADFWCAAGDFILDGQRMPPATMIYRISAPPRHSGEGIDFSLLPDKAQDSGITTFGATSKGMTAGAAQGLCGPGILPFFLRD